MKIKAIQIKEVPNSLFKIHNPLIQDEGLKQHELGVIYGETIIPWSNIVALLFSEEQIKNVAKANKPEPAKGTGRLDNSRKTNSRGRKVSNRG